MANWCKGLFISFSTLWTLLTMIPSCIYADVLLRNPETLILGVHPYLPGYEIQERFEPLRSHLQQLTGKSVKLVIATDYQQHITHVGEDLVDIAYLGPASYGLIVDHYGQKPIIAQFEVRHHPYFHGKIFTRADRQINSLAEVKGKSFAFGSERSTLGCIVPIHMLREEGIDLPDFSHYRFLGNHTNVALGVLAGDFECGAVLEDVYEQYAHRGLKVIATTPPVPEHLFVARSNLPAPLFDKIQQAMLTLKNSSVGMDILKSIRPSATGLVWASGKDYEFINKIVQKHASRFIYDIHQHKD